MTRLICTKCKNAYLKKEDKFICPSCGEEYSLEEENLLNGAQHYNEGDYSSAKDFLMKYIVKNGAEPRAIIYKALCDGYDFDEDTASLKGVYEKIIEALAEIDNEYFPCYLQIANDEAEKLEKELARNHILLFANADAEKIKKEVTTIIGLQNDAKDFRTALTALADKFNEQAAEMQLSLKLAKSFLVEPEIATEVGQQKYGKILENIASHTVFTGILSTEIKNLEIYYRCIVMFFERNRQKYDFLMASAEKFSELSKVLEQGQYNTIKGTATIGDKLKSAAYDFFQESLKDHDIDFETQEESVVIIDLKPETEEIQDEMELEDISSSTLESSAVQGEEEDSQSEESVEATQIIDISSDDDSENIPEASEEKDNSNEADIKSVKDDAEATSDDAVIEKAEEIEQDSEATVIEEQLSTSEQTDATVEAVPNEITQDVMDEAIDSQETIVIDCIQDNIQKETEDIAEEAETDEAKDLTVEDVAIDVGNSVPSKFQKITDDDDVDTKPQRKKRQHKKSYAPIITGTAIVLGVITIIGFMIIPGKLDANNYAKAKALQEEKKFSEAAEIFAKLDDYEDSKEQALQCKYDYAAHLEENKEYELARDIYRSLADFKDSKAKIDSCTYNFGLTKLDKKEYDAAISIFETIPDYADSQARISECRYQKAVLLTQAADYAGAIDIFASLKDYSDSEGKILEAKYAYVKANLKKDDTTTVAYLTDLVQAKYKDSIDIRNKLLGINEEAKNGVSHCINYTQNDVKENLKEAANTKPIYFHITVTDEKHYDKKLTVQFKTSMGYTEKKGIVLTSDKKSYTLMYPSTPSENYTVEFKLIGSDNATLATQKITIK